MSAAFLNRLRVIRACDSFIAQKRMEREKLIASWMKSKEKGLYYSIAWTALISREVFELRELALASTDDNILVDESVFSDIKNYYNDFYKEN